jgi:hypothetical protein
MMSDKGRFFCVFERKFGGVSTVFSSPIAGLRAKELGLAPSNLAKVYVCPTFVGEKRYYSWWAQLHPTGVPSVFIGWLEGGGVVQSVEEIPTKALFKNNGDRTCSPNVCSLFLQSALEWIKKTVVVDDPRVVYKLSWSPPGGNPIRCELLRSVDEDERVLPDWFIDKVLLEQDDK